MSASLGAYASEFAGACSIPIGAAGAAGDPSETLSSMDATGSRAEGAVLAPPTLRPARPSDFILLRVLGRGAFGKVLQVAHRGSGRVYAMKVYSKQFLRDADQLDYTVAERCIMSRLEHAYIVRLRYAFQTRARLFLISDYCAGGELFNTLRKQGLILESAARVYAAEIVLALEHMHAMGVIHRDLKPENILLDAEGHIAITDYGLAKDFGVSLTGWGGGVKGHPVSRS